MLNLDNCRGHNPFPKEELLKGLSFHISQLKYILEENVRCFKELKNQINEIQEFYEDINKNGVHQK